jgi:hypothetical protein
MNTPPFGGAGICGGPSAPEGGTPRERRMSGRGAGLPAEAMREGQLWGLLGYVESEGYKPRSAHEWYAADLLESSDRIAMWLTRRDPGEVETASFMAAHAGYKAREIDEKFRSGIESDALLGDKDRKTRRHGGLTTGQWTRKAAEARNAPVLRMNAELLPKHPNHNERAAIIARKLGRKYWTVRDILKRSK